MFLADKKADEGLLCWDGLLEREHERILFIKVKKLKLNIILIFSFKKIY